MAGKGTDEPAYLLMESTKNTASFSQTHEPDFTMINIMQLNLRKSLLSNWTMKEIKETWQLNKTHDHGLAAGSIKDVIGTMIKL